MKDGEKDQSTKYKKIKRMKIRPRASTNTSNTLTHQTTLPINNLKNASTSAAIPRIQKPTSKIIEAHNKEVKAASEPPKSSSRNPSGSADITSTYTPILPQNTTTNLANKLSAYLRNETSISVNVQDDEDNNYNSHLESRSRNLQKKFDKSSNHGNSSTLETFKVPSNSKPTNNEENQSLQKSAQSKAIEELLLATPKKPVIGWNTNSSPFEGGSSPDKHSYFNVSASQNSNDSSTHKTAPDNSSDIDMDFEDRENEYLSDPGEALDSIYYSNTNHKKLTKNAYDNKLPFNSISQKPITIPDDQKTHTSIVNNLIKARPYRSDISFDSTTSTSYNLHNGAVKFINNNKTKNIMLPNHVNQLMSPESIKRSLKLSARPATIPSLSGQTNEHESDSLNLNRHVRDFTPRSPVNSKRRKTNFTTGILDYNESSHSNSFSTSKSHCISEKSERLKSLVDCLQHNDNNQAQKNDSDYEMDTNKESYSYNRQENESADKPSLQSQDFSKQNQSNSATPTPANKAKSIAGPGMNTEGSALAKSQEEIEEEDSFFNVSLPLMSSPIYKDFNQIETLNNNKALENHDEPNPKSTEIPEIPLPPISTLANKLGSAKSPILLGSSSPVKNVNFSFPSSDDVPVELLEEAFNELNGIRSGTNSMVGSAIINSALGNPQSNLQESNIDDRKVNENANTFKEVKEVHIESSNMRIQTRISDIEDIAFNSSSSASSQPHKRTLVAASTLSRASQLSANNSTMDNTVIGTSFAQDRNKNAAARSTTTPNYKGLQHIDIGIEKTVTGTSTPIAADQTKIGVSTPLMGSFGADLDLELDDDWDEDWLSEKADESIIMGLSDMSKSKSLNKDVQVPIQQQKATRSAAATIEQSTLSTTTPIDSFSKSEILQKNASLLTVQNEPIDFRTLPTSRSRMSTTVTAPTELDIKCLIKNPRMHRLAVTHVQIRDYLTKNFRGRDITKTEVHVKAVGQNKIPVSIILRDDWIDCTPSVDDMVHVVLSSTFTPSSSDKNNTLVPDSTFVIDGKNNYLIICPDTLVSCTSVTESVKCTRKVVLKSLIRPLDGPTTEPLIYGTLIHIIFQQSLAEYDFSPKFMHRNAIRLVNESLEDFVLLNISQQEAVAYILSKLPKIREWASKYVRSPKFLAKNKVPNNDVGQLSQAQRFKVGITEIDEIEEDVKIPTYGLNGKIDVSCKAVVLPQSSFNNNAEPELVPIEIKTSKTQYDSISHQGQTKLYTLLLAEKYGFDEGLKYGLLVYSEDGATVPVEPTASHLKGLLIKRNEIAVALRDKAQSLPQMVSDKVLCSYCEFFDSCAVYNNITEGGSKDDVAAELKDMYQEVIKHIGEIEKEFFKKWINLLAFEEREYSGFTKELWTMTSKERESLGRCFARVKLAHYYDQPDSSSSGKYTRRRYKLERANFEVDGPFFSEDSYISVGETVLISEEDTNVVLCKGTITAIRRKYLYIDTSKNLMLLIKNHLMKHRSFKNSQHINEEDVTLRIDHDQFMPSLSLARRNIVVLVSSGLSNVAKLRDILLHNYPPKFLFKPPPYTIPGLSDGARKLNPDQQNAINQVLSANDFTLILGMPGTGKTTTIAALVETLVSLGKTVLLTSYTHSAVDNILLKLNTDPSNVLRLGWHLSIHPEARKFSVGSANKQVTNKEEMEKVYMQPPIVGVTCLGITHWLLSQRQFDYCIVDEASQVTLPTCLGPIMLAEKFVLVGDHYQLSPLVKSSDALEGGLDESLFKILNDKWPQSIVNLEHQYRMCEDIMVLSNKLIYEGKLKCGTEEISNQSLNIPNKEAIESWKPESISKENDWLETVLSLNNKVIFLNTDQISTARERNVDERLFNEAEANIVRIIVEAMCSSGVPEPSLGVISVYRSQLKLLNKLLNNRKGVEQLTADRFQGRDKDCVIISLVRSNDKNQIGDLLKDWRRLNVAFTRAKSKLIIVGSRTTLDTHPAMTAFLNLIDEHSWAYTLPPNAINLYNIPSSSDENTQETQETQENENLESDMDSQLPDSSSDSQSKSNNFRNQGNNNNSNSSSSDISTPTHSNKSTNSIVPSSSSKKLSSLSKARYGPGQRALSSSMSPFAREVLAESGTLSLPTSPSTSSLPANSLARSNTTPGASKVTRPSTFPRNNNTKRFVGNPNSSFTSPLINRSSSNRGGSNQYQK